MIIGIDDNTVVNLARLFNEPEGKKYLVEQGVPEETVGKLDLLGFSSIANTVMAIKMAKYYEMDKNDIILTVWTDSMELYGSRLKEMHEESGEYTEVEAARTHAQYLEGAKNAQLGMLQYQLNPHFLFNTLNSISALVKFKETEKAQRMITQLGSAA